jgi:Pyruvate/2-oxoacid:ferredoxin oxidoreductase delta subunit
MGGLAAAAAVLEAYPPEWKLYPPRIILVGDMAELEDADRIASAIGASTATIIGGPGRGLHRLDGMVLAFQAHMGVRGGDKTIALKGDMIVIAPRPTLGSPTGLHGAMGLHELGTELAKGGTAGKGRYALLMGEDPAAIKLANAVLDTDPKAQVEVLHRDMAVAEDGMQELQLDLAGRGARFHRYSPGTLSTSPLGDGTFEVRFRDELCPEVGELSMVVDRIGAPAGEEDPGLVWPWFLSRYAPEGIPTGLRLNVIPVLTPRRGVYTTVPGTRTEAASRLGAAAAIAAAVSDYTRGFVIFDEVAEVDPDLCAACLNCLRICPHDAIVFDEEERAACVLDLACQDCGLCAAICPAKAINMVPGLYDGGEG